MTFIPRKYSGGFGFRRFDQFAAAISLYLDYFPVGAGGMA
jgi:hypothetical protein